MPLYDLTVPISPMLPVYPGDPAIDIRPIAQLAAGDVANVSRIVLSSHSGTHIDAPRHFFAQGQSVDALDLDILMGPVHVCALQQTHHITAADLQRLPLPESPRVVFKTPNSHLWARPGFQPDYVALTESAAAFLLARNVQLVGIDYLSVDAFTRHDFPVHRMLLAAGVVILEGLDLRGVPPGNYELLVLPLRLQDGDGAPARAILRSPTPSPTGNASTAEKEGDQHTRQG